MASGNFLIGEDLSLEGFGRYVQPLLESSGYSVQDKLSVPKRNHERIILASVVGEGDLEKGISDSLVASKLGIDVERKELGDKGEEAIAWGHQVVRFSHSEMKGKKEIHVYRAKYEIVGIYQADNTASELFPSIAQEYLLDRVSVKAEAVVEEVQSLLGQKLSDLG